MWPSAYIERTHLIICRHLEKLLAARSSLRVEEVLDVQLVHGRQAGEWGARPEHADRSAGRWRRREPWLPAWLVVTTESAIRTVAWATCMIPETIDRWRSGGVDVADDLFQHIVPDKIYSVLLFWTLFLWVDEVILWMWTELAYFIRIPCYSDNRCFMTVQLDYRMLTLQTWRRTRLSTGHASMDIQRYFSCLAILLVVFMHRSRHIMT